MCEECSVEDTPFQLETHTGESRVRRVQSRGIGDGYAPGEGSAHRDTVGTERGSYLHERMQCRVSGANFGPDPSADQAGGDSQSHGTLSIRPGSPVESLSSNPRHPSLETRKNSFLSSKSFSWSDYQHDPNFQEELEKLFEDHRAKVMSRLKEMLIGASDCLIERVLAILDELTLEHPSMSDETSTEQRRESPGEGQDLSTNLPDAEHLPELGQGERDDRGTRLGHSEATVGQEGRKIS